MVNVAARTIVPVLCLGVLAATACRDAGSHARLADAPQSRASGVDGGGPIIGQAAMSRFDVQVNEHTASAQDAVAVASDVWGRTVVVWQSRRQDAGTYGVYARRLDATGAILGDEVRINEYRRDDQIKPVVAATRTGDVWIAWESVGQDGDGGAIIARRFDASLKPLTPEIIVNERREGFQSEATLAAARDGGCFVLWTSPLPGDGLRHVMARRIASDGSFLTDETRGDEVDGMNQRAPSVAADGTGAFVGAWGRMDARGVPTHVIARRFDASGGATGSELIVNVYDGRMPVEPAVAVDDAGAFIVAWSVTAGDDYGIELRRFDRTGAPTSDVEPVDQGAMGRTKGLAAVMRGDGSHVLAWGSYRGGQDGTGLWGRVFDSYGKPRGEVFAVPAAQAGTQQIAVGAGAQRIIYDADGRVIVAWSGDAGQGDPSAAAVTIMSPVGVDRTTDRMTTALAPPIHVEKIPSTMETNEALPHELPTFDSRFEPMKREEVLLEESGGGRDFGFVGLLPTPWNPPDPHMAVGPDHVVVIANGAIAFFTKTGTLTFQDEIEDSFGFWGSLGATHLVFDPEVIYDPYSDRFIAMANERSTSSQPFFLIAVSDDSDPNGEWHKYRLNVQAAAGDTDIDSPNISVDENAVYLTADFFGPDKYLIYVVEKAPLLVGGTPTTNSLVLAGKNSLGLPMNYDSPAPQYLIESFFGASSSGIRIYAIQNPFGAIATPSVLLTVPTYTAPEHPPSMGTMQRIEPFEARFWNCMVRNGSLWATHHVGNTRILQRWYQFRLNGWPSGSGMPELVQSGNIDPGPGIRTFYGSIWADENDNVALVFARSSPTEFVSMSRAGRLAGDPLGMMRPDVILQSSTSSITSDRWGDYSAVVDDPFEPGFFWGHHEYRTTNWRTWIAKFAIADVVPPAIVSAVPFDGYIDPRRESTDGTSLNQGISHVTVTFDEPVLGMGGGPLDVSAVAVEVTGGVNPGVASIDASANPTIQIELGGVIPVQQFTTVRVNVQDSAGNAAPTTVTYGFLPADINQDERVNPLDLLRFKQIVNIVFVPPQGPTTLFVDINRDGVINPLDLLGFKQLVNGFGNATQAWAGQMLP